MLLFICHDAFVSSPCPVLQLSAGFALWTEAPTAQVVWRCTLKGLTSGEQSVMTNGMTLTLPLSVTSLALPPARLLLEQGKIPFGMACGEGRGGLHARASCTCVHYIYAVLSPGCVYCIRFFFFFF